MTETRLEHIDDVRIGVFESARFGVDNSFTTNTTFVESVTLEMIENHRLVGIADDSGGAGFAFGSSGVKSSPGLINWLRSNRYCLSYNCL